MTDTDTVLAAVEQLRREMQREIAAMIRHNDLALVALSEADRLKRVAPPLPPIRGLTDNQDISYRESGPELGHAQTKREKWLARCIDTYGFVFQFNREMLDDIAPADGPPPPSELRRGQKLVCGASGAIALYNEGDKCLKRWPATVKP